MNLHSPLLIAALLVSGSASAHVTTKQVDVHWNDLNLTSTEGQAQLERRIKRASLTVCDSGSEGELAARVQVRQCRKLALSEAHGKALAIIEQAKNQRLASAH